MLFTTLAEGPGENRIFNQKIIDLVKANKFTAKLHGNRYMVIPSDAVGQTVMIEGLCDWNISRKIPEALMGDKDRCI